MVSSVFHSVSARTRSAEGPELRTKAGISSSPVKSGQVNYTGLYGCAARESLSGGGRAHLSDAREGFENVRQSAAVCTSERRLKFVTQFSS